MYFENKIEFKMLTKKDKDKLLSFIKGLDVQHKVITPHFKSWFKGKIYFRTFIDYAKASKFKKELLKK